MLPIFSLQSFKLPSPIKPDRLAYWLQDYDPELRDFVVNGFISGFSLGFEGLPNQLKNIRNLNSTLINPFACENIIEKEVSLERFLGPFHTIPFEHFNLSPIGLVPKRDPGCYRLIIDLSQPKNNSINSGIPEEYSKVKYASLYSAINLIINPRTYKVFQQAPNV